MGSFSQGGPGLKPSCGLFPMLSEHLQPCIGWCSTSRDLKHTHTLVGSSSSWRQHICQQLVTLYSGASLDDYLSKWLSRKTMSFCDHCSALQNGFPYGRFSLDDVLIRASQDFLFFRDRFLQDSNFPPIGTHSNWEPYFARRCFHKTVIFVERINIVLRGTTIFDNACNFFSKVTRWKILEENRYSRFRRANRKDMGSCRDGGNRNK